MQKNFVADIKELIPTVNDSRFNRILAIGDLHTALDKLSSLWQKISVTDNDLVIFLGDYFNFVDADKDLQTLDWIIEHSKQQNLIFLRGNQEDYLLEKNFDIPEEIIYFLDNMPTHYEITVGGRKYFFCHAGIDVDVQLSEQNKYALVWLYECENFYNDYSGDAVIVVGHKSPKKVYSYFPKLFANAAKDICFTEPTRIPDKNILLLDTRAKDVAGFLSCVDILSGEFWQS